MLHPITLLEAAKVKCLAFVFNPTYSMAEADQAPARTEEIAAQVNPPLQAAAQQPAEIQPAAGLNRCYKRMRYGIILFWFEYGALWAPQSLVC